MKNRFTYALLTVVLVLAGCGSGEPLTYDASGLEIEGTYEIGVFNRTAEELQAQADGCNAPYEEGHFDEVAAAFEGVEQHNYTFTIEGDIMEGTETWTMQAVPNVMKYEDGRAFRADFDHCAPQSQAYPSQVTKNWLLFVQTCGYEKSDEEGRLNGCDVIRDRLLPTVELN